MPTSDHLKETSLRYFLEVARCGSITQASERLFVATSAISRQIAALESILEVPLFERHARGMVLTAAGEVLASYARDMALEADRVVADIIALQGLGRGKVNLACSEGFALHFIPSTILEFQRSYPGIQFDVTVSGPTEISELVRNGEADIGLALSRIAQKEIRIEYSQPSPVLVIVRPDHPLASRKSVTLSELAAHPLVLPSAETSLRQTLDIACSKRGLVLEPKVESNFPATLHRLVLDGGFASLAGEVSVRHFIAQKDMVAIPIRDRGLEQRSIELQTLVGRKLPIVVQTFAGFLKDRLAQAA
jgi:DNA-binding transcriptional LysR family regulator